MKSKLKETIPKIAFLAIPLTILAVDFFVRWDGRIPAMVWSRPENLLVSIGLSVILWWAVSRLVGLSKRPWLWAALISFPTAMLLCAAWRYRQVTHNDASVGILLYAWGEPGNALGFAPHGFSAGFAVAVIILASLWTLSLAVWRGELSQFSRRLCMTMPAVWVMAGFVAPPGIPVYGSPYLSDLHVNQLMGEATLRIVRGDAGSVLDVAQRLPMPKVEWADRPNIIVIVVESLRYDRVSAFGYERDTTPRMKAFMEARNEEVFVFERAYTPSPYSPLAMASVLTGLYPSRTKEELHQVPVLWQYAEAYGAKSFLITPQDWTLAGLTEFFLVDGAPELSVTAQNFHAPVVNDTGVHDGLAAERIARYFREDLGSDDRFLGVIKPNAPHFPFLSAEDLPWPVENIRDRYDGSVRLTDELFGTLIDVLEETGRLDDTIIIYTSDHSEFFYNLDGIDLKDDRGISDLWRDGLRVQSCHPAVTRVPMWMYVPDKWLERLDVDREAVHRGRLRKASNIDVVPTALDALGLMDLPEMANFPALDGQSLLREIPEERVTACFTSARWVRWMPVGAALYGPKHGVYSREDFPALISFDLTDAEVFNESVAGTAPSAKVLDWAKDAGAVHPLGRLYFEMLGDYNEALWPIKVKDF